MFKILNSQKGLIQIVFILLLLAGIIAGVYLVQKTQIFKSKAYQTNTLINSLTNDLISAKAEYTQANNSSQAGSLNKLEGIALERKDQLIELLKTNPQAFLDHATLFNQYDSFPKEVQPYIEKQVSVQGEIAILHTDNFKDKQSTEYPTLIANKTTYKIYFNNKVTKVRTGDQVKAKGITLGRLLVPQDFTVLSEAPIESLSPDTRRTFRIGVVLMEFEGEEVLNRESIRAILFGSEHSLDNYYRVNSYGRLSITGKIFEPVVIKEDHDKCIYEQTSRWTEAAEQALLDQGVDINGYNGLIYLLPPNSPCRYTLPPTTITTGKQPSRIWIAREFNDLGVYVHEIGHSLGIHNHANVLYCGGQAIGPDDQCKSIAYGDAYDPMGMGNNFNVSFHMNAPHKLALGFINEVNIINIDPRLLEDRGSPIRVTVLPLERLANKIETSDFDSSAANVFTVYGRYYPRSFYLEYRQPIDYDSLLPSTITRGVLIHQWDNNSHHDTNLIHMGIENSNNIQEAALSDGQTFEDIARYSSLSRLKIKQISHDTEGAVLEISINQ